MTPQIRSARHGPVPDKLLAAFRSKTRLLLFGFLRCRANSSFLSRIHIEHIYRDRSKRTAGGRSLVTIGSCQCRRMLVIHAPLASARASQLMLKPKTRNTRVSGLRCSMLCTWGRMSAVGIGWKVQAETPMATAICSSESERKNKNVRRAPTGVVREKSALRRATLARAKPPANRMDETQMLAGIL